MSISLVTKGVKILREEGFIEFLRALIRKLRHSRLAFSLSRRGLLSHDTIYGSDYYDRMDRDSALRDGEILSDVILQYYSPQNVLELGCGTGRLLYPYQNNDIEVHGVDLSKTAKSVSKLPDERFEIHDLTEPYETSQNYDLILCIEVLEHLPESAADTVVKSISDAGTVAIVTAATPEQGGTHHVNAQPLEYWINKFEKSGFDYKPEVAQAIKRQVDLDDLTWIKDNIMVFKK